MLSRGSRQQRSNAVIKIVFAFGWCAHEMFAHRKYFSLVCVTQRQSNRHAFAEQTNTNLVAAHSRTFEFSLSQSNVFLFICCLHVN